MTTTHSHVQQPGDDLRERMVAHVMRRDRLTERYARELLRKMDVPTLTRLELEMVPVRAGHTAEYDPFGR